MGSYGIAAEDELHLTEKLFWGIFDSLSHKVMTIIHIPQWDDYKSIPMVICSANYRKWLFLQLFHVMWEIWQ